MYSTMQMRKLSPTQEVVLHQVLAVAQPGSIVIVNGEYGTGRSTILRALREKLDGCLLTAADFMAAQLDKDAFKFEEEVYRLLIDALREHETVLVDDFDIMLSFLNHYGQPRRWFIEVGLRALSAFVEERGKRFILSGESYSLKARAHEVNIPELTQADQEHLFRALLPAEEAERLHFDAIYAFAPKLTCRQIALACAALRLCTPLTTEVVREHLRQRLMDSNVELTQVEEVTFDDLKGLDSVLGALRVHVLHPLLNQELARELDLHPKRGVLLYGRPGTGKTSIGRALAHELGAKFLLIDGTLVDEECDFFELVRRVFTSAQQNAPSVVFIDDSDVLFKHVEDVEGHSFYRFLLSQLDGMHSKGKGDVCVIMTAMDVSDMPQALVRSGRIELWLEVTPPDEKARLEILEARCASLLERFPSLDLRRIATVTKDFTGADLRRVVEDASNQIAYAITANGNEPVDVTAEFLKAAKTLRDNMERYRYGPSGKRIGFRANGGNGGNEDET